MPPKPAGPRHHPWRFAFISFLAGAASVATLVVTAYLLAPVIQRRSIMPPRASVPAETLSERREDTLASWVEDKDAHTKALVARMHQRQQADPDATMDFLVLSGGGANGAFGSGFLIGWATVPPGPDALPTFDGVSGVSTGALIAPFAFLGSDQDDERNGSGGDGCLPQIAIAPSP